MYKIKLLSLSLVVVVVVVVFFLASFFRARHTVNSLSSGGAKLDKQRGSDAHSVLNTINAHSAALTSVPLNNQGLTFLYITNPTQ